MPPDWTITKKLFKSCLYICPQSFSGIRKGPLQCLVVNVDYYGNKIRATLACLKRWLQQTNTSNLCKHMFHVTLSSLCNLHFPKYLINLFYTYKCFFFVLYDQHCVCMSLKPTKSKHNCPQILTLPVTFKLYLFYKVWNTTCAYHRSLLLAQLETLFVVKLCGKN